MPEEPIGLEPVRQIPTSIVPEVDPEATSRKGCGRRKFPPPPPNCTVANFSDKRPLQEMYCKGSNAFFTYLDPMLKKSVKQGALYTSDLHPPIPRYGSYRVASEFLNAWHKKVYAGKRPSIMLSMISTSMKYFIWIFICIPFYAASQFLAPFSIQHITEIITPNPMASGSSCGDWVQCMKASLKETWPYILAVFGAQFIYAFLDTIMWYLLNDAVVRTLGGLIDVLYSKMLTLSDITRQNSAAGNIVNLLFSDTMRLDMFLQMALYALILPALFIVYVVYMGVNQPSALGGFTAILVILPIVGLIMWSFLKVMGGMLSLADQRIKRTSEVLNGIKVVKLFGMENIQEARIMNVRKKELSQIRTFGILMSGFSFIANGASPLMSLFAFLFIIAINGKLPTNEVYTITYLYGMISILFVFMPIIITGFSEMMISSRRIGAFLSLPEPDKGVVVRDSPALAETDVAIKTTGKPSFCWGLAEDMYIPSLLDPLYRENMRKRKVILSTHKSMASTYAKQIKKYQKWRAKNPNPVPPIIPEEEDLLLNHFDDFNQHDPENPYWPYVNAWATEFELPPVNKVSTFSQYFPHLYAVTRADTPFQGLKKMFMDRVIREGLYKIARDEVATEAELKKHRKDPIKCAQIIQEQNRRNPYYSDLPSRIYDLDLTIKKGELVGICGPVGSGKSTLFSAFLGEIKLSRDKREKLDSYKYNGLEMRFDYDIPAQRSDSFVATISTEDPALDPEIPHIYLNGTIAYFAQSSCIFSGTLRDNILFHRPFDRALYEKVIEICCLIPDLKMFKAGDLTEIGEKGVSLSGGQKARVALARAVYSGADILLLDDPLSAVDSHVGQRLWNDVMLDFLKKRGTTVLIASHQTQYFKDCDRIIRLEDGRIVDDDAPAKLLSKGINFGAMSQEEGEGLGRVVTSVTTLAVVDPESLRRDLIEVTSDDNLEKGRIVQAEAFSGQGSISCSSYAKWFKAGSYHRVIFYFIVLLVWQAVYQYQNVLIGHWTSNKYGFESDPHFPVFPSTKSNYKYLGIYAGCIIGGILLSFLSSVLMVLFIVSAGRTLLHGMLRAILRSPLAFFDTTPTGRILSRFSKDTDSMDLQVMRYMPQALSVGATVIGMVAVISATAWPALIVVLPAIVIYVVIFLKFRTAAPQIKRLDSVTRSPVFNMCAETIASLPTIRAYNKQNSFLIDCREKINVNVAAYLLQVAMPRWLSFRLNLVGTFFSALVTLIVCMIANFDTVKDYAGLIIGNALSIQQMMNQFIITWVNAESELTSVERVIEYNQLDTESLNDLENPVLMSRQQEGKAWPSTQGAYIDVQHLRFRYRPNLDLTLKDCSFKINAGEHVGVVGRTGAGKSSLTQAFFRIAEADPGSSIEIDGVNILTDIGLHQARGAFAIIPQEPFLFSGTLRQSLCVYSSAIAEGLPPPPGVERIPDEKLWRVLEQVQMREYFEKQPGGLDAKIAANGDNLSAGQRQLVCVARALVRDPKIVILDEATAQVDRENDRLIQDTIRETMASTTIFSIAHRLDTVIDFDRILVVDAGKIAEYDTPANLLRREGSIFSQLVEKTGPDMAKTLRAAAFKAETQRKNGEPVDVSEFFT
ncbi:Multidrug resistance-associated protein 1 [Giardia muris]|uniref:Multidrug resistance-associated protein 1 n=1 Tax=Giardia muris TaxID=5742 RepID=A0A4Z1ST72_GIAMU|nr:Multidrug resistance-associated protein 1 [Giardia muris]|eukprot:TNJ28950.1 Multidrug resistance-associated protein 1 [Giardia muris]